MFHLACQVNLNIKSFKIRLTKFKATNHIKSTIWFHYFKPNPKTSQKISVNIVLTLF